MRDIDEVIDAFVEKLIREMKQDYYDCDGNYGINNAVNTVKRVAEKEKNNE